MTKNIIKTTCTCGRSVELKKKNSFWKQSDCKCGTHIRLHNGKLIVEKKNSKFEEESEKEFKEMKNKKEYSSLGWWFWTLFITKQGKEKKFISKLYNSLTKREQNLMEKLCR